MVRSCQHILMKIMKQRHGHVFNKAVDIKRLNLCKYFDIIKHPIDHGTVKSRLDRKEYRTLQDFTAMPRLTEASCTAGTSLSPPLHFEHLWSGYLCPIVLQYLVNNSSEINFSLIALAIGSVSGLSNVIIHCLIVSISVSRNSFEFE
ncbi:hypothetical protein CQW23_09647 [Capsicum baccatum]|uniref:Bromo domain-containing protein n=1 Tax=Capsicum baccatum TaxID=33114 RepID=A0A2G2WXI3_CAPBA|nr:hypothetical protein CQW23_09647 [Capsicum baccatum]